MKDAMKSTEDFRLLFLEDHREEAELAILILRQEKLCFTPLVVQTEPDFLSALNEFKPDIVISDYSLPTYNGMSALLETKRRFPVMPFILLTGSINEETAVKCMKAGATDYILKERLKRLPFAVKEALEQAKIRAEKEKAEAVLKENEERLRHYFSTSPTITYVLEIHGKEVSTVWVSDNITRLLGYSITETLAPDWWMTYLYPDDRAAAAAAMDNFFSSGALKHEYRFLRKDGSRIWIHDDVCLLYNDDGSPREIIGSWTDISEKKVAEEKMKASLEEKQVLLRELYHRTKNNMQVIIAMLSLQAASTKDELCKRNSKIMENRILAMSLVHEKLYHLQQLSRIDLREYVSDLVDLLSANFKIKPGSVAITVEVDPIYISIDSAVPCGLVLNELISNSFQYAFVDGRKGEIVITAKKGLERRIVLTISDNGVGLPQGFDCRSCASLGFLLIVGTVEHQLRGKISFNAENGFSCRIEFPDTLFTERV